MPKYIDADEFVSLKREWYCDQCEKRKGMKRGRLQIVYEIGGPPCRACDVDDMISDIEDFPAADVEPKQRWISVTERLPECEVGAEIGNVEWISHEMVFAGCFGRGGKYRDAYFRTWTDATEGIDAKDADCWRVVTLPEWPKEEDNV
ncbi:MAG: hypothetical protein II680_05070 [Clostridia bacterium]|nr:hypothetical protein [Clostridia bacterium]